MEPLAILLIAAVGLAVAVYLWMSRRGTEPEAKSAEPGQLWNHREDDPEPRGPGRRCPDYVEHELDFKAMRYRTVETYFNDEIGAESDTSIATEDFTVRRGEDGSWQIKLVARNYTPLSKEGEWQDGPAAYAPVWEEDWQRRQSAG